MIVKICDFGLASSDNVNKRSGTPNWIAPELLRGDPITNESEVYSLGVIIWEMLTNQVPFLSRSYAQIRGSVGYCNE